MFNIFGPSARALSGMMPGLGGGNQIQGQRMPQGMPGMDMMQGMGQPMPPPMIDAGPSPEMQQQMMPPTSMQPPSMGMANNMGMRQKSPMPTMKAGQSIANKMKAAKSAKNATKPKQGGMMNRFRDIAMQLGPMAGDYMLNSR